MKGVLKNVKTFKLTDLKTLEMILDLDSEMRALQSHEIRTHKDALRYFTARYSSFTFSYPMDAPLPAFALAQHGFHFESHTRLLKCATCNYTTPDLYDDLLLSVLFKHLKASPTCEQARRSLNTVLTDGWSPQLDTPPSVSVPAKRPVKPDTVPSVYATEEARIRSFDNEKLLISVDKLASNGFYRVPKSDSLGNKEKLGRYIQLLLDVNNP